MGSYDAVGKKILTSNTRRYQFAFVACWLSIHLVTSDMKCMAQAIICVNA